MKKMILIAAVVLVLAATAVQGGTKNWNNGTASGVFATAGNWVENASPVSTNDTVVLDDSAGTAWMNSEFTIGSGQSMTAPGGGTPLRIGSGDLTVAAGGTLDFASSGASLAENAGGGSLTFEPGSTVDFANVFSHADWTWKFIANASGASIVDISGFWHRGGPLELDLTNYDTASGVAIVLIDYAGLSDVGVFSSTNVTGAPADGSVNYAYDQGGGDLAIAYVLDIPYEWNDHGSDHAWTTADNWNLDTVPGASDEVVIGANYSVTNGQQEFGTLTIGTNTTVLFSEDGLQAASTITCSGTVTRAGVWRLNGGGTLTLTGTGSMGAEVTWLDLQGADLNFHDGASFGNSSMNFEARGVNVFGFTFSETGFTALDLGGLWDGGSTWADKTFNIDISAYDRSRGTTITLMDFVSGGIAGTFDPSANSPTVNITGHSGGTLSWEGDPDYDLVLEVVPVKGTLISVK